MATFAPTFTLTPLIQRQLRVIDETRGFLKAVRTQPEWVARLRREARVRDALASVRIEGSPLSYEQAFALTEGDTDRDLDATEQELVNYLRAFDAIDGLRGERDYPVRPADVQNLHRLLVDGVRGGQRFAGQVRREDVSVGDRTDDGVVVHHQPPPWPDVQAHLDGLFTWIEDVKHYPSRRQILSGKKTDPWVHPCVVAAISRPWSVTPHLARGWPRTRPPSTTS